MGWHFSGLRGVFRWMCGVKIIDRLSSSELRERLGMDDYSDTAK